MKKYIKPAIEELNLGATMPLMTSSDGEIGVFGAAGNEQGYIDPDDGGDGGYGMWAPSRKGSTDDEDFGW